MDTLFLAVYHHTSFDYDKERLGLTYLTCLFISNLISCLFLKPLHNENIISYTLHVIYGLFSWKVCMNFPFGEWGKSSKLKI